MSDGLSGDSTALSKGRVLLAGSLVAAAVTAGLVLPRSASSSHCPPPPTPSPNPDLRVAGADVYTSPSGDGRRVQVRRGDEYAVVDANPEEVRAWAGADEAGQKPVVFADADDGQVCAHDGTP